MIFSKQKEKVESIYLNDVYKDKYKNYYGSTDKLFSYQVTKEEVLQKISIHDLTFFGRKFDCEPIGDKLSPRVLYEIDGKKTKKRLSKCQKL